MARTLSLLLALAACGPGAPPAAEDTSGTTVAASDDTTRGDTTRSEPPTTGEADSETDAPCLEVEHPSGPGPVPEWQLGCDAPQICAGDGPLVVFLHGTDLNAPESVEIAELERIRCMVEALAQRRFGQFAVTMVLGDGTVYLEFSIEVLGDQAIVHGAQQYCELVPGRCRPHEFLRVLRPPAFFAACVDGDAKALWLCLNDSMEPEPACLPGPLVCPPTAPDE